MKRSFPCLIAATVLLPTAFAGAQAPPPEDRLLGKYLVEICTVTTHGCKEAELAQEKPGAKKAGRTQNKPGTNNAGKSQNEAGVNAAGANNADANKSSQPSGSTKKIKLKQVGCAAGDSSCPDPVYPLSPGEDFYISAKVDPGKKADTKEKTAPESPVCQTVKSGKASKVGDVSAGGVQKYHVNGPGTIEIRAKIASTCPDPADTEESADGADANGEDGYEIDLAVAEAGDKAAAVCYGLEPGPPTAKSLSKPTVDAAGIANLIGNPTPFILTPQGDSTILIYSTRFLQTEDGKITNKDDRSILGAIKAKIEDLAKRQADSLGVTPTSTAKPFSAEIEIPHAAALGDPAARISGLNYSAFTVQDIGSDRVRVSASKAPACVDWTAFLSSVRHLEWQPKPEPFQMKLYYLSSSDAATAFTSLAGTASSSTPASTTPSSTPAATAPAASTPAAGGASATPANSTISVTQPLGSIVEIKSNTTPCITAGLALGNTSACAPAPGTASSTPASSAGGGGAASSNASAATPAAPKPPPGMASMAVAAGTSEQNPPDLLVFSDTNPGDDEQITERKRILAQLDLPRPEMIINAWIMQNSTASPRAIGAFSGKVKALVEQYNKALEELVLGAWTFVKGKTQLQGYFDQDFYHYVTDQYVADTHNISIPANPGDGASQFLDSTPAHLADSPDTRRDDFGICDPNRYCLGYNLLFQPLRPHLTDLLLTLIAAKDPPGQTVSALHFVEWGYKQKAENPADGKKESHDAAKDKGIETEDTCESAILSKGSSKVVHRELVERCKAIRSSLGLDRLPKQEGCVAEDYGKILHSMLSPPVAYRPPSNGEPEGDFKPGPRIFLSCFEEVAKEILRVSPGLLRANVADFLFQYKMSQQYPHEFSFYDLSQSADALNAGLSPIIDAFNRDIVAFQTFMRADVQYQVDRLNSDTDQRCCVKRLFGLDKPSFFNDGLVTVRTISGQLSTVNTTSQSVVDASRAPTLSELLNNIATPAASSSSGASPLAGVLGARAQPSASLLAGVLNSYQTASATIGRQLNLQVTPRSLSTASSAEINVTLNADETAGGPTYSGGPSGGAQPNTSRVASHDITTRIRVESVKLFELSSFSAIVERSRSRFPLLPPFVEIPYIGTILGIPIPAAKEYHASTAVISAMVVPTAADIAFGLRFVFDRVVDGDAGPCSYLEGSAGLGVAKPCRFRRAVSLRDFKMRDFKTKAPLRNFHKSMINCFATDMKTPYSGFRNLVDPPAGACEHLSFGRVPGEE